MAFKFTWWVSKNRNSAKTVHNRLRSLILIAIDECMQFPVMVMTATCCCTQQQDITHTRTANATFPLTLLIQLPCLGCTLLNIDVKKRSRKNKKNVKRR